MTHDDRKGTRANGPAIVALRKARGLSQEELAHEAGCSVRVLRKAEKGEPVRITILADLAATLSLEVGQLLAAPEREPFTTPVLPLGLTIPDRQFDTDRSPPGALLRAEFRQVPFHGREDDIADLHKWCDAQDGLLLRLYTGPGGMGKTRLLVEACHARRAAGWLTGFLGDNGVDLDVAGDLPLLVVLDYAETRVPVLLEFVRQALGRQRGKIRIVLLARAAVEWWHRLRTVRGEVGEFFQSRLAQKVRLTPVAMDGPTRVRSFRVARAAFATTLGRAEPRALPAEFIDALFDRVLLIHMLALASLTGIETEGEHGILDVMLAREERYWSERRATLGLPDYLDPALAQAMAVLTLAGGADSLVAAEALLAAVPLLADQPAAVRHQVATLLRDMYPGERWIEPLQPDILGEHLVGRVAAEDVRVLTAALGL